MKRLAILTLLIAAWALPAIAQGEPPQQDPRDDPELRNAVRVLYERQLRTQLGLSDEQMEAVRPEIAAIDEARAAARREQRAVRRALGEGMRGGASDDELLALLVRLDGTREQERLAIRESTARVDEHLSVRQRVQWRMLTERFQQQLRRRMHEIQQGDGPPRRRGPGERPPRDNPAPPEPPE